VPAVPLASIGSVYQEGIVDAGKQAELFFLLFFLVSFGFIRTSTHMIRAQVSWWPGNVSVGGTHIHHLVWGILLLLIFGYVGVTQDLESPWIEINAALFGVGTGLTLDEFALWLNLKDVYWSEQGRRSIDAVIVAAILAGFVILGIRVWIDVADDVETAVVAVVGTVGAVGILFALINAAKEKFGVAVVSLFVPLVGIVGAFRLARPHSIWAKYIYGDKRRAKSRQRFGAPEPSPPGPDGRASTFDRVRGAARRAIRR
jgi:hypothetical protein